MKKKWTRRKFLETGLKGSIAIGGTAAHTSLVAPGAAAKQKPSVQGFDLHQRETLRAAMDEIIPAGDGMPAASEVGGVEYLERLARQNPGVKKDLERSLAALDELSRKQSGKAFSSLARAARVEVLKKLEKQPTSEHFATLRDLTYEAFYTQPRVWTLIGYEFYPTNQAGPHMKPFDEAVLSEVRKRPKLYREVP